LNRVIQSVALQFLFCDLTMHTRTIRAMNLRQHRSTIFCNGPILTMADDAPEAVLIRDGFIEAVGSLDQVKSHSEASTKIVDLGGQTLMPAFIDAHMHLVHVGLKESGFAVDLSKMSSLEETLELIEKLASEREAGTWIRARGWDEMNWPEKRYVTKSELDEIAPDHLVSLTRVCGHLLVANSKALQEVHVAADSDEVDYATGTLREQAVVNFSRQTGPSELDVEYAIMAGSRLALSLGITKVHDYVSPNYIRAYQSLKQRDELPIRITMHPFVEYLEHLTSLGLQTGFGDEMLRLGAIKLFTDGSIGARNAALFEPYLDSADSTTGKLNYDQSELNSLACASHDAGFQLSLHAIGDRAIEAALEALTKAGVATRDRARIEHLELPTEGQLEKMAAHGIIACMQPNFVQWSGPESLYEIRLGADRDARMDPHQTVLSKGVKLAFGSDGMPFEPLYGIHKVVNAPHEQQRLSVDEALLAYTLSAAHIGFDEDSLGSLEVGKTADLVVLSENPIEHPDKIDEIEVLATYLGGELVYERESQ